MNAKARVENGLVIGTAGNKYTSRNPLARRMVRGFDAAVSELAASVNPRSVLEVGCGEGHIVDLLLRATGATIHATDISATCVAEARTNVNSDRATFAVANVLTMEPTTPAPDLVVCCEVLEHLDDPEQALKTLLAHKAAHYLVSVPREPIWRILNFSRGAYVKDFGNSPGHFQHWSRQGFLGFISPYLKPLVVRSPLPWTVVLCVAHGA